MRALCAVIAMFVTLVVTVVLVVNPLPLGEGAPGAVGGTSLGRIFMAFGPPFILTAVVSLLLAFAAHGRSWRGAAGLGTATRSSIALGLLWLFVLLGRTFGSAVEPSVTARPGAPLWLHFTGPLAAVAVGALLFDSLRVRAARREGRVPAAAFGDGLLLALVALSGVAMLLTFARY